MRPVLACSLLALGACASMHSLNDSHWLAEDIDGRGVVDNVQSTLEISASGHVAGRGGCNRYVGSVEIKGNSIQFGELASTRMACPEALMNQEDRFLQALRDVRSWKIEDTKLLLFDAAGNIRLRFDSL